MKNSRLTQIILGLLIVLFGLVILVDLFARFVDMSLLVAWWPMAFILIGFVLLSSTGTRSVWIGVALLLAGTVAILDRTGLIDDGFRPILIATSLVLVGLLVITPVVTADKTTPQ